MATVLQEDGYSFRIYSNDHEPAHVHVIKADAEAIVNVGDEDTKPLLRENYGMSKRDVKRILNIVSENQGYLLEKWREIHGS